MHLIWVSLTRAMCITQKICHIHTVMTTNVTGKRRKDEGEWRGKEGGREWARGWCICQSPAVITTTPRSGDIWLAVIFRGQHVLSLTPTVHHPWFQPWSLNLVDVEPLPHWRILLCSWHHKWRLVSSDLCKCGGMETVSHTVESCTISQFDDLIRHHSADDDAVTYGCRMLQWKHSLNNH